MCVIENNRTWAYIPHCCGIERFELHTFYIKFSFFLIGFGMTGMLSSTFVFTFFKKKKHLSFKCTQSFQVNLNDKQIGLLKNNKHFT